MAAIDNPARTPPASESVSAGGRRSWPRRLVYLVIALAILIGIVLGGVGWYFSSQVLNTAPDQPTYSLRILALHGKTVEVTRTTSTLQPGTYNLQWHGGQLTLGAVVSSSHLGVVRRFTGNSHGLHVGMPAHFDIDMYASPGPMHVNYQAIHIPDPLGPMPAWYIPGRRSAWAILVHGRGMNRREGLRPLSTLVSLGLPVLDLSYRNDIGAPSSSDRLYHLGASEWQDVQASARYAAAHGARSIVLFGYSMGGSIVESFLHRSPDARLVRAVVLDAPALDWNAVLDFRAGQSNVPGPITAIAKRIVAWRIGLGSLRDINGVHTGADLRVPTLLYQGTGDTSVPAAPNAALALARPDLVTYVSVPGAEHTQAWNADPTMYIARLKAFLTRSLR